MGNKFIILVLLSITIQNHLFSQSLEGRIIDSETNQPISYAHIYATQSKKGTLSNESGEFELTGILETDTLIISHIGFESVNLKSIQEFSDLGRTLYLKPKEILLDQVTVLDLDIDDVVYNVMNFLKNKSVKYGKGFYRQISFQNSAAMEWIEAFYNMSFSAKGIDEISIDQARFARKNYDTLNVFISHTNFSYLIVGNSLYSPNTDDYSKRIGKPFSEDFKIKYKFSYHEHYSMNSNDYLIINFEPIPEVLNSQSIYSYGNFVFNLTQNKLVQYSGTIDHSLGADDLSGYTGSKKIEIKNPKLTFQFNFSEKTGDIEFIKSDYKYDMIQDGEIMPSKVSSVFVVYQQLDKKPNKLRAADLELEDVVNFERAKYIPKYWKDNAIIKRTSSEEAIISTFEKNNAFGTYFK